MDSGQVDSLRFSGEPMFLMIAIFNTELLPTRSIPLSKISRRLAVRVCQLNRPCKCVVQRLINVARNFLVILPMRNFREPLILMSW